MSLLKWYFGSLQMTLPAWRVHRGQVLEQLLAEAREGWDPAAGPERCAAGATAGDLPGGLFGLLEHGAPPALASAGGGSRDGKGTASRFESD